MDEDAAKAVELFPGAIVRLKGRARLWRAVEPAKDRTGRSWWFLPCDRKGNWDRRSGWTAAHPDRCLPPGKGVRA